MRTIAVQDSDELIKTVFEIVDTGEAVRIQGPSGKAVVISEDEYNTMAKAWKNAKHQTKIEQSALGSMANET